MDKEKVIKRLEVRIISDTDKGYKTIEIPVNEAEDILALLKEQEGVKPEWKGGVPFCGNCGHRLQKKNRNVVGINCPMCKRSVQWE